jgi:K+/H+ antiporter YhaU regulatory subunit KhtT
MMNLLKRSRILMVAEGLDLFRVKVPEALAGSTLERSAIRERTGCSVVALGREQGMQLVPGADTELEAGAEMLLIGSIDAEERFLELFPSEGPVAA